MDLAQIQALVQAGYGIGATQLGVSCTQYRPAGTGNPIVPGNIVGTVMAGFDSDAKLSFTTSPKYGKQDEWYGLLNGSTVQVGDYLVTADGRTFFIAAFNGIAAPLCILCNRTLSVFKPADPAVGAGFYGGNTGGNGGATGTPVLTSWPASVLQGTKGEKSVATLPGDTRAAWFIAKFPALPGITINEFDIAIDDLGQRYTTSSVEVSGLGFRVTISYQGT